MVQRFSGESGAGHKEAICIALAYGIRKSDMQPVQLKATLLWYSSWS